MMGVLEILTTSDGSHTVRNTELNETYHSKHGALQESMHVFIRNGLQFFHETNRSTEISVFEVGFGTGLNAMLAWQYAEANNVHLRYHTLEPFPLAEEIWSKLNYRQQGEADFSVLHNAPWDREVSLSAAFTIIKEKAALHEAALKAEYDVIFFDAFAPSVQPVLWEQQSLQTVARALKPGGVFVTYSAKGKLKRDLAIIGLIVETLPGPPGKREMVRARAPQSNKPAGF